MVHEATTPLRLTRPSSAPRVRHPSARGYTIVELAVVVAVVAVISVLTFNSINGLRARAEFSSVVGQLASDLQTAQHRATADQRNIVVVFFMASEPDPALRERYFVLSDPEGTFDLADFDPEAVEEPQVLLAENRFLPNVRFGPETGSGGELPAPFRGVPAVSACSFCSDAFDAPFDRRGTLTFAPDGTVVLSGNDMSGSVTVQDVDDEGRRATVAVIGRTGAVRSFQP